MNILTLASGQSHAQTKLVVMDRDVGKDGRRDSPKPLEKGTNTELLMALLFLLFISDTVPIP